MSEKNMIEENVFKELIKDLIDKTTSLEECELIEDKYRKYFMGDEILDIIYKAKKAKGYVR